MPVSLSELAEKLNGKQYSKYVLASCLWHDDQHPSMLVFVDGYKCFGCGRKGPIKDVLAKIGCSGFHAPENKFFDFSNPIHRWLGTMEMSEIVYEANRLLRRFPLQAHFLKLRGVDCLIEEQNLGWWEGWYVFPVYSPQKKLSTIVIRAGQSIQNEIDKRYVLPNNAPRVLYCPSWQNIQKAQKIYVVFGILDALSLHILGLPVVTGITGQNFDAELLDEVRKPIEIVPDQGEENQAYRVAGNLGWRGKVRRLLYPDDSKDPNEVYWRHGADVLRGLLA